MKPKRSPPSDNAPPDTLTTDAPPSNGAPEVPPLLTPILDSILDHYSSLPHSETDPIRSSLDLSIPANQVIVQRSIAGGSVSLWDVPRDTIIEVEHLVSHYTEALLEETGEVKAGPMLTLIGPKGVWHTASEFAYRALQTIKKLTKRSEPFNPPLKLMPVRLNSRKKNDYQSLLLVE